ncbi:phage head-tail connector protein [Pseudovibrio exalbescens]|uniref:head-tail connector protein n=1 Tax=Pseudovibrio exalbescens TaxID=197461 RepID=UPI002365F7BF|nr:phage head-tail connector protein [Pseudovibrio exalbescens]MDD7909144.1 phage head-tail connector protein [Pseudovibrio exalbescens]
MTAVLVAPPVSEPVGLQDAHAHLRLSHTLEDGLLTRLITAARQEVERISGRALITQGWRLYLDEPPKDRIIRLPMAPVSRVDAVNLYDADGTQIVLTAEQYVADLISNPARIRLCAGCGTSLRELNGIEVEVTAGYGDAPEDVPAGLRTAILMLMGFWYERRNMVEDGLLTGLIPHGFAAALSPYKVLKI